MSQESLPFGRLWLVEESARQLYRHLNDAVDAIGVVPAAGACGIDRADLRRALDRKGRHIGVEHAMAIHSVALVTSPELAAKICSAFVKPSNLEVSTPQQLTPEQKVEAYERLLRSMPLGDQLISQALGGRR